LGGRTSDQSRNLGFEKVQKIMYTPQMKYTFTIPGVPIPQHRPRFTTIGGYGRAYSAKSDVEFRKVIQTAFFKAKDRFAADLGSSPFPFGKEIPLRVELTFLLPIPDSYSQKKRASALARETPHVKKPDVDNLMKGIFDGLKGHAWHDDSQVIEVHADKYYHVHPMTVMTISVWRPLVPN